MSAPSDSIALIGGEVVGEADRKVQEERRLDGLRGHVAPVDDPVEGAGFAGRAEAVEDEGSQAEDVKMDGLWGRPAPEENVDADAEVDEGDEAQALIDGAVFGLEDDLDVKLGCAVEIDGLRDGTEDRVVGVGPDAAAKHLANQGGDARGGLVIDADEDVAGSNAGSMAGRVCGDALGTEAAGCFDPPDAVGRNIEAALAIEVHGRKDAGGDGRHSEHDSQNASLGGVLHQNYTIRAIMST